MRREKEEAKEYRSNSTANCEVTFPHNLIDNAFANDIDTEQRVL